MDGEWNEIILYDDDFFFPATINNGQAATS